MNKQEVIEYCLSLPNVCVEYPYGSRYTALRYSPTRMTFAVVYEREDKLYIELIIDYPYKMRQEFEDIMPAYRMNKSIWSAVAIGGDVDVAELYYLIHCSYELAIPRLREHNKTIVTRDFPWPVNFYCNVFGIASGAYPDMPEDPVGTIEFMLNTFSQREKDIVLARYKDYKIFKEIGEAHSISSSRAAQIHNNIMRKIRRSKIIDNLVKD